MTRRTFLGASLSAAALGADVETAIRSRIRPPQFASRTFEITRYSGDVNKAIAACADAGGGRVIVPRGEFPTGPIHLKSRVELHLAEGSILRFSVDPKDYPSVLTRWEGTECWNYSPLIYALDQSDIAITGTGTLDGQAGDEHWWNWKGRDKREPNQAKDRLALQKMAEAGAAVKDRIFGAGHFLRPQFIQPYRCQNVLIESVTIRNSPMWEIHPVLSKNVTVRNVKIESHGPNNDGCDPESCSDVLIQGCVFDTGDDCIAIKSGRNADGRRLNTPCENLIVEDCTMKDGHGGVSIGSEISGGVRNVFVKNCRMSSPHLERALRLKTNSYRGGVIENISFRGVTIGEVSTDAIQVDFLYEEGEGGPFQPVVRNVEISDVTCGRTAVALNLRGYASSPIRNVRVERCTFDRAAKPNVIEHVEGLELRAVTINGKQVQA